MRNDAGWANHIAHRKGFALTKRYNSYLPGSRMPARRNHFISRRFDQKHGDIHQTRAYAVANSFSTVSANVSTSRRVE
jgi:hypothetical protein